MLEAGTLLKYAAPLLKNSKLIQTTLRRLRYRIKHGRLIVIVFGPGGTGKSTLGRLLIGEHKPGSATAKYQESISIEKLPLGGDLVGQVLVAPGQGERRARTWTQLYQDLASGKSVGIVNVVSWGYHAFANPTYRELGVYKDGMTQEQVLEAFLQQQRDVELQILRELEPHLSTAKGKLWMVTLITKEDLWWKRRADVEQYYRQGEYAEQIQAIAQKRGANQFTHEHVCASLAISNMTTDAGERFFVTAEGYDQNIQADHLQRLLDAIDTLAKQ